MVSIVRSILICGIEISCAFLSFLLSSFLSHSLHYWRNIRRAMSEEKSTSAETPVETQSQNKHTGYVFNEQTNYVPKRTIITVFGT